MSGLPKVLLIAEHASARFGGEAILPLHYFRILRARGAEVHLLVHERTRDELHAFFPDDDRIHYVQDTMFHRFIFWLSEKLPVRLASLTTGVLSRLSTQFNQRRIARVLISRHGLQVVHQPIPVSPREPSLLYGLGVPVIIGPMNGAMAYPPAFFRREPAWIKLVILIGRYVSRLANRVFPGKYRAALLLVANERTSIALPKKNEGRVCKFPENGVDLSLWTRPDGGDAESGWSKDNHSSQPFALLFIGRLVDWKAVDLLIDAFRIAVVRSPRPLCLSIIGDGREMSSLMHQCQNAGLLAASELEPGKVYFLGWRSQQECAVRLWRGDALALPSLVECGGAVVLEAMAAGKPVIATDWGGPADYLDETCGILVKPEGRRELVSGFADAILRLATNPEVARALGREGRARIERNYDWERKVDAMIRLYDMVINDKGNFSSLDELPYPSRSSE